MFARMPVACNALQSGSGSFMFLLVYIFTLPRSCLCFVDIFMYR